MFKGWERRVQVRVVQVQNVKLLVWCKVRIIGRYGCFIVEKVSSQLRISLREVKAN